MNKKLRLAYVCRDGTANSHYRVVLPMAEMARRGHEVIPPTATHRSKLAGTPAWDVLLVHQFMSAEDVVALEHLRRQGVAVVWDTDDDIRMIPKGSESYRRLGGRRGLRRLFKQTVAAAHAAQLVTTTTERIAAVYRDEGVEHVKVLPNYVGKGGLRTARRAHQGVVVGIVAASEHRRDVADLGVPRILSRLLDRYDDLRVVAFGVDLELKDRRYTHAPRVPIQQLISRAAQFDIALAPLLDTPFNRARSDVKLKEYAAAGAAWLASPTGPYVGMGESRGGLLVADSAWESRIEQLITDGALRRRLQREGSAWVSRETIERHGDRWERTMYAAVLRAKAGLRG